MHVVLPPEDIRKAGSQRLRTFGFAGIIGTLLLLNVTGILRIVADIDTAAILTLIAGYRIFYNAISGLMRGRISADLAIVIAVAAAFAAGAYAAAAEAIFIMLVGEGLETYAATRTQAAIHRFVEQMPRRARRLRKDVEEDVDVHSLDPGDIIVIRAGERVPADGIIRQGQSSLDESAVTGESLPRDKSPGDEVFSGALNGHGLLQMEVTRAGDETTLARVIQMVKRARQSKAPVERLADRWARYFLPALLLVAAATFYFTRDWLRTVSVLIVACPCALILATPAAMVAAIGGLARRGILVRGGGVIERAAKVDGIVFDKTGTVTEGNFTVVELLPSGCSDTTLLALAAAAESASGHTLARVIVEESKRRNIAFAPVENARVVPGKGVECLLAGTMVRAGNTQFLAENGIGGFEAAIERADAYGATAVLVAEDSRFAGAILLRDTLREGVVEALHKLEQMSIPPLAMLTGDRRHAAESIAREAGIPHLEADLLPEQKLERIQAMRARGQRIAMVGDGINDAPSLAASDLGIAVSGASDITAEAADAVYLSHSLDNLPVLFTVSREAVRIVWQNIVLFAGLVNVVSVYLAYQGVLGPLTAAITHQVSSLLVMLNSVRLLRAGRTGRSVLHRKVASLRLAERFVGYIDPRNALPWLVANRKRWLRPVLYVAASLLVLNGFYCIKPEEEGVLERFGRRVQPDPAPGLHYKLPWPLELLTRLQTKRVRVVEIGFRSGQNTGEPEPDTYEWNVQHRAGRFQRREQESAFLTGDQNMIEINAIVHYRLVRPADYLLRHFDADATVRAAAESTLHFATTGQPLSDLLTTGRSAVERTSQIGLQRVLDRYAVGVEVLQVRLLDVHPSLETVGAFRDVAGAYEEKSRLINEAEGYRNENVALARGNAEALLQGAVAHREGKANRAGGDASRFTQAEAAFRSSPALNETRLYLETMEQVLPGKQKVIVDTHKGRRHFLVMEDGVISPPAPIAAATTPRAFPPD